MPQTLDDILTQVVATHDQAHLSPEPLDSFAEEQVQGLEGKTVEGECPFEGPYRGQLSVHPVTGAAGFHVSLTDPVTGRKRWMTELGIQDLGTGRQGDAPLVCR